MKFEIPPTPEDKEIPGRSLLEKRAELAEMEQEDIENGKVIKDESGNELWRKKTHFAREKDRKTEEYKDTSEIKAITEEIFERDEQGRKTKVEGTNLDRVHSWETAYEYDEEGNVIRESGKTTEGEKQGEDYDKSITREQVGSYIKTTETNRGKHFKEGELRDFEVIKVNHKDAEGKTVWGYQEESGKPESRMEWGKKPDDITE